MVQRKLTGTTELSNKWHRFYECTFIFLSCIFCFFFFRWFLAFLCSYQKCYCESIKKAKVKENRFKFRDKNHCCISELNIEYILKAIGCETDENWIIRASQVM